jgi:hypothetical protein
MKNFPSTPEPAAGALPAAAPRPRRPWLPPRIVDHGDVRELTMGTSSGLPESGAPGTFRA